MKKVLIFLLLVGTQGIIEAQNNNPQQSNSQQTKHHPNKSHGLFTNNYIGYLSGLKNTSGKYNVSIGYESSSSNTTGNYNSILGSFSGRNNKTGNNNSFLGSYSGFNNTIGKSNTAIGSHAGYSNKSGEYNTYLGSRSGFQNTGSRNVFIGYRAGAKETGSNKLYIANSNTQHPLIYGDFSKKELVINGALTIKDGSQGDGYVLTSDANGNATWAKPAEAEVNDWTVIDDNMYSKVAGKVGIGTSSFPNLVGDVDVSNYKLFVKGGILSEEVRVHTTWADYVFHDNYTLKSLEEVENYIHKNKHLPNIPSAKTIENEGVEIGNITRLQQEKIEELTLYTIQQQKEIDQLKKLVNQLINTQETSSH